MTDKPTLMFQAFVGKGIVPQTATISSVGTPPSTISETSVGASLKRKATEKAKFYELVGKALVPRHDMD